MNKRKGRSRQSFIDQVLRARHLSHTVNCQPLDVTRQLSEMVSYPRQIYDVARSVDIRRIGDNHYRFNLRQKRYLGRGTYAISAYAIGEIYYDTHIRATHVTGITRLGGQYVALLTFMSAFVLLSAPIVLVTILFLPLLLLMASVISLHWTYLWADQRDLQQQFADLQTSINSIMHLNGSASHQTSEQDEVAETILHHDAQH